MTESLEKHLPGDDPWQRFRRQMPVASGRAYLDHAAVAPLTGPAREAITTWLEDATVNGDVFYPRWKEGIEDLRRLAAGMIGATPEEIALVGNTTAGINLVAEGFPWQPGDNVVLPDNEFPSNQYPWMNLASRGVEARRVPMAGGRIDLERLAAACDRRTRIVALSWVSYSSGWRSDLDEAAEMAHRHGALLLVDAIQGLGVFPLDVRRTPIDFLASDGHKWLLGPEGAGVFFIRREHLGLLRPTGVGWHSVAHSHDFNHVALAFRDTAARFEGGSWNMAGMLGLRASLALLCGLGFEAIAGRVLEITDLACQRLSQGGAEIHSDRTPAHASGIVSFSLPGRDPEALRRRCLEQGAVLSCRAGRLRISPHAYNNAADIDRLMAALR